jgi:hypothetical protein
VADDKTTGSGVCGGGGGGVEGGCGGKAMGVDSGVVMALEET